MVVRLLSTPEPEGDTWYLLTEDRSAVLWDLAGFLKVMAMLTRDKKSL